MEQRVFRRKIYDDILDWKRKNDGRTALLVEGARRIGKSTIVEEFARNEYKSYILIDFNTASAEVKSLFDDLMNLEFIFLRLQQAYSTQLFERNSVIVFDEVQQCPKARQAIKYLVKDGRYDYIETGSLISIRKNIENITKAINDLEKEQAANGGLLFFQIGVQTVKHGAGIGMAFLRAAACGAGTVFMRVSL